MYYIPVVQPSRAAAQKTYHPASRKIRILRLLGVIKTVGHGVICSQTESTFEE